MLPVFCLLVSVYLFAAPCVRIKIIVCPKWSAVKCYDVKCTCHLGRKPPKLPIPLGISLPCQRSTEPRPWAACTKNLVNIARVVWEICSPSDRHTLRRADYNTSQLLPRAK